jgi:hypothetical protein
MPPQRPSPTTPEALQALRERLEATQRAAQRLAEEAASDRPPPAGWDVPRSAAEANDELDALVHLVASVRELLPAELRAQLAEVIRQILLFVRAALDWWLERIEGAGAPRGRDDAEDIPIS